MASRVNAKQQRQAAAAAAAEQAAKDRRARTIKIVALVGIALVVVGLVVWRLLSTQAVSDADPGPQVPSEKLDDGIAVGEAEAPVVEIYLDFLCSHCADLEERIGDAVADMALDGEARIVIHPITLLDPTESARSAAAFGCAAGTESVLGFQKALFANAAGGFSTERLVEIAASVGLTDSAFVQCVEDDSDADWAAAVDAARLERGIEATPTIYVNGTLMDIDKTNTPGEFRAEVALLGR